MTQDSVQPEYLYRLARSGSQQDRRVLAEAMNSMIHAGLSANEQALAQDILLQLLHEAEHELKLHLAKELAKEPKCPFALLDYLVYQNDFEIAEPVLRYSEALSDEYLIEIVRKIDLKEYRRTIAHRAHIGQDLARALVATDDIEVFKTLLANKGAHLCPASMNWLINVAVHITDIQKPLIKRPEITAEMAAKLFWYVSEDLRNTIATHFDINQNTIDALLHKVVKQRMAQRRSKQGITTGMMDAAFELKKQNRITSRQVLDAAKKDNIAQLSCLWGALLILNPHVIMDRLEQNMIETLAVLSIASRFTRKDYSDLFMSLRRQKTDTALSPDDLGDATKAYDALNFEKAQYIVHGWQTEELTQSNV